MIDPAIVFVIGLLVGNLLGAGWTYYILNDVIKRINAELAVAKMRLISVEPLLKAVREMAETTDGFMLKHITVRDNTMVVPEAMMLNVIVALRDIDDPEPKEPGKFHLDYEAKLTP